MIDLGSDQDLGAIFLPAIQTNFSEELLKRKWRRADRPFPDGLSIRDLNFLNPKSKLFTLKYALCSAGTHLGHRANNIVSERDRGRTVIVGDSGGYQIITGTLKWEGNRTRQKVLSWLETHCDWAMTLDAPTKAITSANGRYQNFGDCLRDTLHNLDYFAEHRAPPRALGSIKFLNVLQGRDRAETDQWYQAVRGYPFEGWAFAGDTKLDLHALIRRLLIMHEDGLLKKAQWIHVLGVGTLKFAAALTAIRDAVRRRLGTQIQFSFDVSTPFLTASTFRVYAHSQIRSLSLPTVALPSEVKEEARQVAFPFSSPIGDRLVWNHLWQRPEAASPFDLVSHVLCQNHNVYVHSRAVIDLNRALRLPDHIAEQWLPKEVFNLRSAINSIFDAPDPMKVLKWKKQILDTYGALQAGDEQFVEE